VPHLFELATDCSIRVSRFSQGDCSPPAPQCCYTYMIMIIKMIEIAARPYYYWHTTSKQLHRVPHLHIYRLKEGTSLPAMFNPLFSGTNQQLFKKNFCKKVATMKITDYLLKAITCLPLNRHFLWWKKMNGSQRRAMVSPWRMHCMYSGMAKGTSWAEATWTAKNQARSLSHCWVTGVWRNQAGRQLVN